MSAPSLTRAKPQAAPTLAQAEALFADGKAVQARALAESLLVVAEAQDDLHVQAQALA